MIPTDIRELLSDLLRRSKKKEVNWIDSSTGSSEDYTVNLPAASINIWVSPDGDISGAILNSKARPISTFSSGSIPEDFLLLQELLESARRKVLSVDETIADIRRALRNDGEVGVPSKKQDDDPPF